MSKPPFKALESLRNYCEKTQCRRCVFGFRYEADLDYVGCKLQKECPCDWMLPAENQYEEESKTNADRIRSMTDEELAEYYFDNILENPPYCRKESCTPEDQCEKCLLDWLRQEAKQ